jgi:hypothetical protein
MAVRTCRVTRTDPRGIEHTIQVSARSLHEAVAQALPIFREDAWCKDLWQSAASLVAKISQPAVEPGSAKDFTNWLDSARQKAGRDGSEEPAAGCPREVTLN